MIIYKVKNLINGKIYIGQTTQSLNSRIYGHKRDSLKFKDIKFYRAANKYGWDNFEFSIIDDKAKTLEELCSLEKHYIEKFDSYKNGYNSTSGGEISPMMFEETRKKVSKALTGRIFTDEHKKNISEGKLGKAGTLHTEEHKSYMSRIMQGRKLSKEHIENMRKANLGKKQSKETIEKRMKHIRGVPKSPEHTKKLAKILNDNRYIAYGKENPRSVPVVQIDKKTGEILNSFECISDAAKYLGVRNGTGLISRCINGKGKTAYGFKWQKMTIVEMEDEKGKQLKNVKKEYSR